LAKLSQKFLNEHIDLGNGQQSEAEIFARMAMLIATEGSHA